MISTPPLTHLTATTPTQKPKARRTTSPLEIVGHVEHRQECPSAERVECGRCGKTFAGGAIVTGPSRFDPQYQHFIVVRQLFCDHCDHLQVWIEKADRAAPPAHEHGESARFRPTGLVISGPGYIRQKKMIANFLTSHPEAAGVTQA